MKFVATEEQVNNLMAIAVNASKSVGFGFLHVTDKIFKPEDFKESNKRLDYVQGRMVKLYLKRTGAPLLSEWSVNSGSHFNNVPNIEYNSWASTYPEYSDLFEAAGITEFERD